MSPTPTPTPASRASERTSAGGARGPSGLLLLLAGVAVLLGVALVVLVARLRDRAPAAYDPRGPSDSRTVGSGAPGGESGFRIPPAPPPRPLPADTPGAGGIPSPGPGPARPPSPSVSSGPTTPATAAAPGPWGDEAWGTLVTGPEAAGLAVEAERLGEGAGTATPGARRPRFAAAMGVPPAGAGLPPATWALVEALPDGIRLGALAPADPTDDPLGDLVPPAGLVGPVLTGTRLEVAPADRGRAIAALARLAARDARAAQQVLLAATATPGVRVLRAYASLVLGDLSAVHATLEGLSGDAEVGPVAHLLTGAAMRLDGNAREAVRDLEAAVAARPAYWPALLLEAEAYDSEGLSMPDKAATAYAAALALAPEEPAAILGTAFHRAAGRGEGGPAAARAAVEDLLRRRPTLVAAWRLLARIRSDGATPEERRAGAQALEHVVALRPSDGASWGDLGGARWRWAQAGGGRAAYEAAAEAFGKQTELEPEDAQAWLNRGGALHQAAMETPLAGDATAFRARLGQARLCYGRALAAGLSGEDAAQAHYDLGLLLDLVPPSLGPVPAGFPSKASEAFRASLAADPGHPRAGEALVAALVAEGDGVGAQRALEALAASADAGERACLEAAVAWVRGEGERAREALRRGAGPAAASSDVRTEIARSVLVLGHAAAALALLPEAADAAALEVRVRARAALRDVEGVRADLARLETVDGGAARRLRSMDPLVGRVVAPPR